MTVDNKAKLKALQKCAEHVQHYKLRMRLRETAHNLLPMTLKSVECENADQDDIDLIVKTYSDLFFEIVKEYIVCTGTTEEGAQKILDVSQEVRNTPVLERDCTDDVVTFWTFVEFSMRLLLEAKNGSQTNDD